MAIDMIPPSPPGDALLTPVPECVASAPGETKNGDGKLKSLPWKMANKWPQQSTGSFSMDHMEMLNFQRVTGKRTFRTLRNMLICLLSTGR